MFYNSLRLQIIYCVIFTATDNNDVAKVISHKLLEKKLAACVQIDTVKSFFVWEGEVKEEEEYRVMIKTTNAVYKDAKQLILQYHNYNIPEILKFDISKGFHPYLDWVSKSVGNN